MEVFYHHIRKNQIEYDPSKSGADWWVQIRPSPPAGRYKLLVEDSKRSKEEIGNETNVEENGGDQIDEEENERNSICFHWDKDEDLRLMMDGKMYIHPHVSTVTYLSSIGAPTMALNYRVNAFNGEYIIPNKDEDVEAYISWPKKGKHLSFDGRYLHSAPHNLMNKGLFKQQTKIPDALVPTKNSENENIEGFEKQRKVLQRRFRRTTFLVNIWLNYKPFNVEIFPESMIDKLSKTDENNGASHILFKNDEKCLSYENSQCDTKSYKIPEESTVSRDIQPYLNKFQWTMGGCNGENETISMEIPLEKIQKEIGGGNLKLRWETKEGNRRIQLNKESDENLKRQRIK